MSASISAMENPEKNSKREAPISLRIPKGKAAEFEMRWQRSGLSKQGFIWSCVFDGDLPRQVRRVPMEKQLVIEGLNRLSEIKDAWRETNRLLNDPHADVDETLEQLNHQLLKLRALFFKALGRKG